MEGEEEVGRRGMTVSERSLILAKSFDLRLIYRAT